MSPSSSPLQWPTRIVRFGLRIRGLQNAHRLEHRDRARAVVRRAAARVPRVEVRRQHHVLVRLLAALDARDRVEHRRLGGRERRLGDGVDARMLAVVGETREQAVVLARDVERRHGASRAPTGSCRRPSRATTSSRACRRRRRARAALAVCARVHVRRGEARGPLGGRAVAQRGRVGDTTRIGPESNVGIGAAGRLRHRSRAPAFPSRRRASARSRRCRRAPRRAGCITTSAVIAAGRCRRAPRVHRRLEHASARRDEREAARAARPVAPRAVLLVLRVDAPRLVGAEQPVVGGAIRRRAGEPRADRVHEHLGEAARLRAMHAFVVDALDDGIAGRIVLGERARARE